ncbi:MAG: acetyl-CoA carboxylase biotin carboxylase subunit [Candidatus Aminicenantes bacterium]|nr:acetyl-CoA carboxylase biotin carboxylase subunit [Candidatus Aminicenantes bacterium]
MFKKILIANRGEIAVRIIRACRELGITPVAVYSDVDSKALHVKLSIEAYPLGGSKPSESYLNIDKIIDAAKKSNAEAIHPGYGFLAENPIFVRRCEDEGLTFIGPSSEPIRIMGNKTEARQKMVKAGVPVIPGTLEPLSGEKDLIENSEKIGFPLLLKASAGGGGKGLRLVKDQKELLSSFRMARSEAESSFGDSSVYMEKYIQEPHHIEVQILADSQGQVISLGERECSIQRRYQKIIEETPSPFLKPETREKMEQVAVEAARAVGYQNAGTVEFVVDGDQNFYFLEMNTRLQVEHPVTEMVTGIDIVKSQIEIASGKRCEFSQQDVVSRGASLECRIYAEDPYHGFMPSPGKIRKLRPPSGGLGIRYDNGTYEGYEVPVDYDPLLSKLITWGTNREEAIRRMQRALSEYQVYGIVTIIPFFKRILTHPDFFKGNYNTHFLEGLEKQMKELEPEEQNVALIAAGITSYRESRAFSLRSRGKKPVSNWKIQGRLKTISKNL